MGLTPMQSAILANRLEIPVSEFFSKYQNQIPSPYSFDEGEKAVKAISDAIWKGEKIWLVSDYDMDGIGGMSSCVYLLHHVIGVPMENLIIQVSRRADGYGLTRPTIDKTLKTFTDDNKPSVLVTMDIGSANGPETMYLQKEMPELKIVVTDHHHVPEDHPVGIEAFVNPNKPGCNYEDKTICGAAVVFFILDAVRMELQSRGWQMNPSAPPEYAYAFLAASTVADVVSMQSPLNRMIVSYGLFLQNQQVFPAFAALKKHLEAEPISEITMGWTLGPMVNATTRLQKRERSPLMFFTATANARAFSSLETLLEVNTERKEVQKELYSKALNQGKSQTDSAAIIISLEDELPGVAGGVASMLVQDFNKPVILLMPAGDGDLLTGSSRAPEGYDLVSAYHNLPEGILVKAGGHKGAAGLSLMKDKFDELYTELNKEIASQDVQTDDNAYYDFELTPEININQAVQEIRALAPYGQKFEAPVFKVTGQVKDISNISKKSDAHKNIELLTPMGVLTLKYFNAPSVLDETYNTFLVELNQNYFNGSITTQLSVKKALKESLS